MNKIETFINKLYNNIKSKLLIPVKKLGHLHEIIRQINVKEVKPANFLNPYDAVSDWLLDVVVSGTLISIVIVLLTKDIGSFIKWTVVSGFSRYMIIDFIKEVRKAVKGE